MRKLSTIIQFGEKVEGYALPVLNEREIRAAAGIMFLALLLAFMQIFYLHDFQLVKYVVLLFFSDFLLRVFVGPRFSPILVIGRLIVSRQVPEYVSAPPKKFAWSIGLVLSGLMFLLLVVLNSYSIITAVSCVACLVFLFFESAFGICLGCWVYRILYKNEIRYCAGGICDKIKRQDIQQISRAQIIVVTGAMVCILLIVVLFNEQFRIAPKNWKEVVGLVKQMDKTGL